MVKEKITLAPGSGHLHETRMMHIHKKGHTHPKGNGHVKVFIEVEKSEIYSQQGLDLIYKQPITFSELCLGDKVEVILPDDSTISVSIPSGTKVNQILRVKDKGIQQVNYQQVGDLLLDLNLSIPKNLTEEQLSLLKKLKQSGI